MKVFLLLGDRLAVMTEAMARVANAMQRVVEAMKDLVRPFERWTVDGEQLIVVRTAPRSFLQSRSRIVPGGVWRFPDKRICNRHGLPRWSSG